MITAAGNGGSRQIFQEHFIHEYLITLTNKHRFCVAICRINHRNPVRRQQHLTLHAVRGVLNTGTNTRDIKASVLHLLQLHSPHAVQVIICINLNLLYLLNCRTLVFQFLIDGLRDFIADIRNGRPDFSQVRRKLTVINLRPQLLSQMGFPYLAFEKIQIAGCIITRLTNSLHECRFANGVHTANVKIIIMARFDIDTGGYPVQRRTKITRAGFNLPDISNPFFREPELKLYRRIINRKMRRGGYLKIARRQLNPRRCCRCGNPEQYRRRIALLPPGICRPDCQPVVSQRQLREAVCGFRRPGRADQPLTAVVCCHSQAKHKAHPLHHLRRVPSRQHLIFPAVCSDFGGQMLHC